MLINESGLIKAMKEAQKAGGYKVALHKVGTIPHLALSTGFWVCSVELEACPKKVLALIVEQSGRFPELNKAFQVRKKEIQDMIFDVAMEPVRKYLLAEENSTVAAKQTLLHWNGREIWQREDNLAVMQMDPMLTNVLQKKGKEGYLVGGGLLFEGNTCRVLIMPIKPGEDEKVYMDTLGNIQWQAYGI